MLAAALALVLSMPQDPAMLDVAVYRDAAFGVELPRPFADWIFAPATERGTTTVIFQPRAGSLSDQLWGVLVLTPWDGDLRIGEIADRRIDTTWRTTLGSFALVTRDSQQVSGFPAIRALMSGTIDRAVLEVEEYLIARGSDLVVLQFRYPRGVSRDSVAAGYARALRGLVLRETRRVTAPLAPGGAPSPGVPLVAARSAQAPSGAAWSATVNRGQVVFDLPEDLRAVAPGWLTSEVVGNGRRVMRFSPAFGEADTTHYAVGHFRLETRRVNRLTVRLWRSTGGDAGTARAADSLIAAAADAFRAYWKDFGPVPTTDLTLVETAWPGTVGGPAIVFLGADAADLHVLRRELARTWWGALVREGGPADSLVAATLPDWSSGLVSGTMAAVAAGRPGVRVIELARLVAGEPRFREALRSFVAESRNAPPNVEALVRVLGDTASVPIRTLLR